MHHPDIYDILSIVEDYFLLSDRKFRCKVEPVIYAKPYDRDKPDEDLRERKGLKINSPYSRLGFFQGRLDRLFIHDRIARF